VRLISSSRPRLKIVGAVMGTYSSLKVKELKAELKLRGLRVAGTKDDLVKRLRDNDWEQWILKIPIFNHFPNLPLELQSAIWRLSLPGPRTLFIEGDSWVRPPYKDKDEPFDHFELKLDFSANGRTPNPAALSACRASRDVALKFYRLCFGTTNVYADLPGGDILCFGHRCISVQDILGGHTSRENPLHLSGIRHGDRELPLLISPSLFSDLSQVTNIALWRDTMFSLTGDFDTYDWSPPGPGGPEMRRRLFSVFPNLAVLSLIISGDTELCEPRPSQLVLEPVNTYIDEDSELSEVDMQNAVHQLKGRAYTIMRTIGVDLTDEERQRCIPRVQLVHANRLLDFERLLLVVQRARNT
jgi:hypothetical protein